MNNCINIWSMKGRAPALLTPMEKLIQRSRASRNK